MLPNPDGAALPSSSHPLGMRPPVLLCTHTALSASLPGALCFHTEQGYQVTGHTNATTEDSQGEPHFHS